MRTRKDKEWNSLNLIKETSIILLKNVC
jgi:hypothetical protein